MIKNVSVMVTDECNSRCSMCNIWKGKRKNALSSEEFGELFSRPGFREIEDLSITGGEATLRTDLIEVANEIVEGKEKLRMLFLCSNGTNPDMARKFVEEFNRRIQDVFVAVSLEGTRESTREIRGIDSYDSALETIRSCKGVSDQIHTIISTTITPTNCNEKDLNHLLELATVTGSTFSFKPIIVNGTYYKNETRGNKPALSDSQKTLLERFIEDNCMHDPFMRIQLDYMRKGNIPLMGDRKTGVKCLAGDVFAFVRPSGDIYPCFNSTRKIGGLKSELPVDNTIDDLGNHEPCPCCNEMCIYPMINWANFTSKK